MIKIIQMTRVMCDKEKHKEEQVSSLCVRSQCYSRSASCQKCLIESHRNCLDSILFFENIPQLITTIVSLETEYQNFLQKVDQALKQIKNAFDTLLKPIKDYQETPNLKNLNRIGQLLRMNPSNSICQSVGQSKKIISDEFTKLYEILIPLIKIAIQPAQCDLDEAEKYYEECETLQSNSQYQDALNCIERAIQLCPNNIKYFDQKGVQLICLNRLDEAVEAYTEIISIKPIVDAYLNKADSLFYLNRIKEAINCLEQGLIQLPNDPELSSLLKDYKQKLKQ